MTATRRRTPLAVAGLLALVALVALVVAVAWRGRGGPARPERLNTPVEGVSGRMPTSAPGATATLGGQVRDARGGALAGATVCVLAAAAHVDDAAWREPRCTSTDTDGRYRHAGLPSARYAVHASAPGLAPVRWRGADGDARVTLAPGAVVDDVDLVLRSPVALVSGRVVDIGGGPIAGASISTGVSSLVSRVRGEWVTTGGFAVSDEDGRFTVAAPPGELMLRARAEGYADGDLEAVAPAEELELRLTPAAAIEGVVVDAADRPVAGALVELVDAGVDGPRVRSAVDGRFRIAPVAPGRHRPRAASSAGLAVAAEDVVVGLGQIVDDVRLVLRPAGAVEGQVLVATTPPTPCVDAVVRLTGDLVPVRPSAVADAEGRVTFLGVPPGRYQVSVRCLVGRSVDHPSVSITGTETVTARWSVEPGGSVRGRVVDGTGRPVTEATVATMQLRDPVRQVGVDRDGRFVLQSVPAGGLKLSVEASGYAPETRVVEVPGAGEIVVDFTLAAGGTVTGTVHDTDGHARGNHLVRASHSSGAYARTRTAHDGAFRLGELKEGAWTITAEDGIDPLIGGDGPGPRAQAGVVVVAGEIATAALVVEDGRGRITGRVVDSGGTPVPDAWVAVAPGSGLDGGLLGTRGNRARAGLGPPPVLTSTEGHFAVEGLAPARYDLYVHRPGGGEAELSGLEPGADLAIVLERPGSIEGTVVVRPAGPLPPWFTVTRAVVGQDGEHAETFVDTAGRFRLVDLSAASYRLSVDAPGYAGTATAEVVDGRVSTVAVTLDAAVGVRGRVVELGGHPPIAGVVVEALRTNDQPGTRITSERTGPDGQFQILNAPRGLLELFTYGDGGTNAFGNGQLFVDVSGAGVVDVGELEVPRRRVPRGQRAADLGVTWRSTQEADPRRTALEASEVRAGSPAAVAGLRVGDRLAAVDGVPVVGRTKVARALVAVPPGTTIRLTLVRGVDVVVIAPASPPRE